MESQPQNPEFGDNLINFHPWTSAIFLVGEKDTTTSQLKKLI